MEITDTQLIEIAESSQLGDARRRVQSLAVSLGFDEKKQNRLALITAELCTNLLKHTPKGGQLLLQQIDRDEVTSIDLYAIDRGNGMDAATCLVDGFSSAGTLGTGLGAIKRLADESGIWSKPAIGSVVHARVLKDAASRALPFSVAGLSVPKKGEPISGDKWSVIQHGSVIHCLVVDGLGHGIEASEASELARKRFKENFSLSPTATMKAIHTSLRGTRGAVAAVAKIDCEKQFIDYCGLGNISGIVCRGAEQKHLVSMNGTVGYEARKFMEFRLPWSPASMLIMHSDGLSSRTSHSVLDLESESEALIAGCLFLQHGKSIDDATVLVVKQLRQ